jgi:hypothetical protein
MYAYAIYRTVLNMGPHYVTNVYTWLKTALWDAPYRVYLDVELEKVSIEREINLSEREHTDDSS